MSTTRRIARKAQTRKMANRHRAFRGLKHQKPKSIRYLLLNLELKQIARLAARTACALRKVGSVAKSAGKKMSAAVVLKSSDLPDDIF